mmetsp:Transcript_4892/g.11973  ORF Transcript_4892/g.11973 Transcript_4892/m.11973 type:complete len:94 (-) Transcript_4892:63-344(-)
MNTAYNWVVPEETVRQWYTEAGFKDYIHLGKNTYLGMRKHSIPVTRDDHGLLMRPGWQAVQDPRIFALWIDREEQEYGQLVTDLNERKSRVSL